MVEGCRGGLRVGADCLRTAITPVTKIVMKTMAKAIVASFFPALGLPTITTL